MDPRSNQLAHVSSEIVLTRFHWSVEHAYFGGRIIVRTPHSISATPMPAVMNARGITLPPVAKVAIEMIQLEFAVAALTWGHGGYENSDPVNNDCD